MLRFLPVLTMASQGICDLTDEIKGFTRAYTDILNNAPNSYRTILLHLANEPTKPLIVHCTAGKDRTGVFCALILSLCGVEDDIIAEEYSLTEMGLPIEWKEAVIEHLSDNPVLRGNKEGAWNLISARYHLPTSLVVSANQKIELLI